MHKWQFGIDEITGIVFIIGGILFVFIPNSALRSIFSKSDLSPQKIKKKRTLYIIGGIVFILYGTFLLVGYIKAI